ncbi:hypothetical protein LZ31DRAFT_206167 [Colletotrichum somersetense]|nr:hypothetical protein LZ31DRAFT_206167 [Colletotrichum somersetense]
MAGTSPLSMFTASVELSLARGFASSSRVSLLTLYHHLPSQFFFGCFCPLCNCCIGFPKFRLSIGFSISFFLLLPFCPSRSVPRVHSQVDCYSRYSLSLLAPVGTIPQFRLVGIPSMYEKAPREKDRGQKHTRDGAGVHRLSREEEGISIPVM